MTDQFSSPSPSSTSTSSGQKRPRCPSPHGESHEDRTILLHKTWVIRSISPFALSFLKKEDDSSLLSRQSHMSQFFRQKYSPTELRRSDGTFVTLSWIQHQHVYVQVTVKDQVVSHLLLCYYHNASALHHESFGYVLQRGNAQALTIIYAYLESNFGCRISPNVFQPSSSDVMSSMASWSVLRHEKMKSSKSNKPLEVAFQTPKQIQEEGLSTITVTIPPASLERLYSSIVENSNPKASADETTTYTPALRAIQYFMYNSFHLDVTSFPLTKVSCNDVGIIGCDGRIKIFSLTFLDMILSGIHEMVKERYLCSTDTDIVGADTKGALLTNPQMKLI